MKKQIKKNKKGFTLVEMIVVIAIIGVLAAMMVPSLLGFVDKANTSNNRAAATNIARTAQTVLAEINDSSISGTFKGVKSGNSVSVTDVGTVTDPSGKFKAQLGPMFDANFKGEFQVVVTNGAQVKVYYSKTTLPSNLPTSASTKAVGLYPEN